MTDGCDGGSELITCAIHGHGETAGIVAVVTGENDGGVIDGRAGHVAVDDVVTDGCDGGSELITRAIHGRGETEGIVADAVGCGRGVADDEAEGIVQAVAGSSANRDEDVSTRA